jgi:uncharacterized protein
MSNYLEDGYHGEAAAYAPANERAAFIRRTYLHLAVSIAALVAIEALLFKTGLGKEVLMRMFGSPISLLICLGLFIGGGFLARWMARSDASAPVKYAGLSLYVLLEAIILLPLLYRALALKNGEMLINQAALLTLVVFGGLTLTVFLTRLDFSGLGPYLALAGWALFAVILATIFFGMSNVLYIGICFACITLAAGYVLYDTSNVLHHYQTNEEVGASIELLADVTLLFYYILRLLMIFNSDD